MKRTINLEPYRHLLNQVDPVLQKGWVTQVIGAVIEAEGPSVHMGEICRIQCGDQQVRAEVVGFRGPIVLLMPLNEVHGLRAGSEVVASGVPQMMPVGPELLGRVIDPLGNPLDGKPPPLTHHRYLLDANPPNPMMRQRIHEPLSLGIKAIDGLLTCGKGQRLGIFAGSGVGKSTLLGMVARYTAADVNVIGLIGERGREVRDFIENDLGEEGLKRSVLVVVTSDQPALLRIKGAFAATAIAEYFRDQGQDVLLMMDSITRFAMARREIGLAIGEPPATRGYPPSVYGLLPRLLERSGTSDRGTITALYTVLVEGDDTNEPIADTVRGILDGHVVLSRQLASRNHYPAIEVLESVSRLALELTSPEQRAAASRVRELLATWREAEDLISIGAYSKGSSKTIDEAIERYEDIIGFLRQSIDEGIPYAETQRQLIQGFSPPAPGRRR
jgi:flagellum-specific ATP synthase